MSSYSTRSERNEKGKGKHRFQYYRAALAGIQISFQPRATATENGTRQSGSGGINDTTGDVSGSQISDGRRQGTQGSRKTLGANPSQGFVTPP